MDVFVVWFIMRASGVRPISCLLKGFSVCQSSPNDVLRTLSESKTSGLAFQIYSIFQFPPDSHAILLIFIDGEKIPYFYNLVIILISSGWLPNTTDCVT